MTPPERVRVLILIKGLGLGGAEVLVAQSAPVWDRTRYEYKVAFLLPWKDHLMSLIESEGVDVVNLGWRGPQSLGAVRRLRELVREWKPDVVHSHLPVAGILARMLIPANHVYTEHNVVTSYRPPTRSLNRWTYGRNSAVIAVSEAVAQSTSAYPGPTSIVVPNGIAAPSPTRPSFEVRRELGIDPGTRLVVHVGNIRPNKGHENLVRAVAALATLRSDFLVVSIGSEKFEGDLARLRGLASDLGIGDRISLLGQRTDAMSFVAAADAVVNPAEIEGLPLTILEAMLLRRPIVATAVGGVPTVVIDRETGLLVAPDAPEELAKGIAEILESEDASDWAQNGYELVRERHGIDAMVEAYETIYSRVVR